MSPRTNYKMEIGICFVQFSVADSARLCCLFSVRRGENSGIDFGSTSAFNLSSSDPRLTCDKHVKFCLKWGIKDAYFGKKKTHLSKIM